MIDIENEVYTKLRATLPNGTNVTSVYVYEPASFPHVYLSEVSNKSAYQSTCDHETHASIGYKIEVDTVGETRKSQAKALMATLDDEMYKMNFIRQTLTEVPNQNNANVFRYVATYTACTDGEFIYRR